ncbi:DUF2809 domain-containing protein [Antarcticibacterium sp. 1MA-6-2]|uniref:ribosomal maturation YjgA family protein n=1 Tax=Antarcticibacterium sp. 1MA-6-2 TaxID=2908210 RepID=UPI001F419B66|nr:DUF2809 domain-containing protein [Antarcticibacterium sp. 1MA-6-2]UJH90064.1 DUF2809 domain-containing protein [Antarcticibacterium sp. 1MA-6-2]
MLTFNKKYFFLFVLLFFLEISIALFVRDRFIRPYAGDFLVIMLLYCFVKSFLQISVGRAVLLVLLFSYLVEILQYIKIVRILNVERNAVWATVLGTQFEWWDIFAYTAGVGAILIIETYRKSILRGRS